MPEDLMRYDQLAQNALRGVVREALRRIEKTGLPGDHHFYITFDTTAAGVNIGERMAQRYPREMTIVLQHQFHNLIIRDDRFEVELSFDNIPEHLIIPFHAVTGFLDPAVQFGLRFEIVPAENAIEPRPQAAARPEQRPPAHTNLAGGEADDDGPSPAPKVISLDAFRKK